MMQQVFTSSHYKKNSLIFFAGVQLNFQSGIRRYFFLSVSFYLHSLLRQEKEGKIRLGPEVRRTRTNGPGHVLRKLPSSVFCQRLSLTLLVVLVERSLF